MAMAYATVTAIPTIVWDDGFLFFFSFGAKPYLGGFPYLPVTRITGTDSGGKVTEANVNNFDNRSLVETVKYSARSALPVEITFDDTDTVSYSGEFKVWTVQKTWSIAG
jgi:hypothetical protein